MADFLEDTFRDTSTAKTRHAREREAVLLAQEAYRKHHVLCFWSFDPKLQITITKVDWVIEQLWRHGDGPAWKTAQQIQDLLSH
jgi:hypothetical protein